MIKADRLLYTVIQQNMPQVSSRKLKKDAQEKLFSEFALYIVKANHKNASAFLQTLLTPTEQIMLAKRIGVIVLLHNNVSTYQIMQKLHMSSATVVRMHKAYSKGNYDPVTKLFAMNKKDWIRFLETLEVVLRVGMPRRVGKRWTFLDKIDGRTARAG